MRRAFVGRRCLVASVGGLGQLRFGAGKAIGQLGHLARKLEDDAILLLHVTLEKSQTLFEVVKPGIHLFKMQAEGLGARAGGSDGMGAGPC